MTANPEIMNPLADLDIEPEPERCAYCGMELSVVATYGGMPIYAHQAFDECELETADGDNATI